MKINYPNKLVLIMFWAFLWFVPNLQVSADLPTPLTSPNLALYAKVSAISSLKLQLESALQNWALRTNKNPDAVSALLEKTAFNPHFKAKEFYLYYTDPKTFAIVIDGGFDMVNIAETIGSERVSMGNEKIITLVDTGVAANERLYIEVTPTRIFACPENNAGNVAFNLKNPVTLSESKVGTFGRLFAMQPQLLLESDFTKELNSLLPAEFANLAHLRLAISKKMARLQLCLAESSEEVLETMIEHVTPMVAMVTELSTHETGFNIDARASSLFITGKNVSEDFANAALCELYAFFLHLFLERDEALAGDASSFAN